MNDIYDYVRLVNFLWASILFFTMTYWGIIDVMLTQRCSHTHVPPEHQLWALAAWLGMFILAFSTGEVLYQDIMGGFRVFLPPAFLFVASFALHQGAFRVKMHKISVDKGMCQ